MPQKGEILKNVMGQTVHKVQTEKLSNGVNMYVRLYEDKYKSRMTTPTIGIILCTDKDETVVKYSVLKENKQLFASKYKLYLPTEDELIEEIEREKEMIVRERGERYG